MEDVLKALIKKNIFYLHMKKHVLIRLSSNLIEICECEKYGDFTSKISLYLNKLLKLQSANIFKNILETTGNKIIKSIMVILPGYINLRIYNNKKVNIIGRILRQENIFGFSTQKNKKIILIEIVSANPTGPLHVGHARNAFVSDSINCLYSNMGYYVQKEYYINNIGNQILMLGKSVNNIYLDKLKLENKISTYIHSKKYYNNPNVYKTSEKLLQKFFDHGTKISTGLWLIKCIKISINNNIINILNTLKMVNVNINLLFEEKILYQNKSVKKIMDYYYNKNIIYYKNTLNKNNRKKIRIDSKAYLFLHMQRGGMFLKTTLYGDFDDRVLLRYNNASVYLLADIAYHQNKISRKYKKIINIFGADHCGHIIKLYSGLKALELKPVRLIENIIIQMVNFFDGKKNIKFSKRDNNVYLFDDLINNIGVNAIKYIFLSKSKDTHLNLNIYKIIKNNRENKFFYIQYAISRISKLVDKVYINIECCLTFPYLKNNTQILKSLHKNKELIIIKYISFFSCIIEISLFRKDSLLILRYMNKIVNEFHKYFTKYKNNHRIISKNAGKTLARIYMLLSIKQIIKNCLLLLGLVYK